MPTSRDNDELRSMKLVEKQIGANYELRVISAKKYAAIEEAVQKQSITNALQAQLAANEQSHKQWLDSERQKISTVLNRMAEENKSAAEITAKKRDLEQQLYVERLKREKELSEKQASLNAGIVKSKEDDEKRVANIASRYADNEYKKATIYQRKKIQQELLDQARSHKVDLQNQKDANEEAIKLLRSKLRTVKQGSEEEKAYQTQLNAQLEEREDIKAKLSAASDAETSAYTKQLELNQQILAAQKDYLLSNADLIDSSGIVESIETAAAEAKTKLAQLNTEIAVNEKLGIDDKDIQALRDEAAQIEASVAGYEQTAKELAEAAAASATEAAMRSAADDARVEADKAHTEAMVNLAKTLATSPKDAARAKADATKQATAEKRQDREARHAYAASEEGKAAEKERFFQDFKENATDEALVKSLENISSGINDALNQIDSNIDSFYEYQATVEARLQGSDESYRKSLKAISKNVGISGLVSQKEVIENLKKMSDAGIAYNLDLRAFLATISEDIANTFDAFDSNLMRLIRLQQSDTTAARLGMEASLTRLFNEFFSDTSYLSDAFDSVSQSIIDANSQLTKDMSVEFEYMVQKWLGALYSLGMDSGTITTIAQGLNYLGTGNVEALNSNDSLQSLLAMSASRAGISYADILTGGLDADTTNSLMKSMIEYLKSIAENTDNNQVTKSAYSNIFGFSISDLTAVSSLSEKDISNLYSQSLTYQGAMNELDYQTSQIMSRTHLSQMIQTAFDNAMVTASTAIGNNAGTYATWMVLNTIEDLTGGIAIPAISVMGNMVDLHQTVTGLAKAGMAGLGLMGSLLGSLFSGSLFGTMDVNKWGYDEYTSRGGSTKGISKGTASGISESSSMSMVGSASASDIKSTSMSDATDSADEDSKITNKNVEENADIYEKIYAAIATEDTSVLEEVIKLQTVVSDGTTSVLESLETTRDLLRTNIFNTRMSGMDSMLKLLDPNRVFYSAIVSMMPLTSSVFSLSEDKVLSITETAVQSAISATSSTVQSSTTKAITKITDVVTSIQEGSVSNLVDSAFAEYKSPKVTYEVVPENMEEDVSTNDNSSKDSVVADITQFGKETSTMITRLESAISNVDVQNIANLMAQTSVGVHDSNDKTTNQLITNDGLKVSINQMSPEVSAYIAATVKSMVASAISGGVTEMNQEGEGTSLIQLLTRLLQTNTLNVNVTNDNFDTALQKTAFTY